MGGGGEVRLQLSVIKILTLSAWGRESKPVLHPLQILPSLHEASSRSIYQEKFYICNIYFIFDFDSNIFDILYIYMHKFKDTRQFPNPIYSPYVAGNW